MKNTFLVITSIAKQDNQVLLQYAQEAAKHKIPFIVIGDTKSPSEFEMDGCDFYSIDRQKLLNLDLAKILPLKHYARKNLGYLAAISQGAEIIIETDDDNLPFESFWSERLRKVSAYVINQAGWTNTYKYFTDLHIWPRGFALQHIQDAPPVLSKTDDIDCPIQQGLADDNPDVDAIYRLTLPLPITFNQSSSIALGEGSICPFNSQNTTWFQEAFPLLYLPYHCSFRMTDIWRSFVAQRIAWSCGWPILFHSSTVRQERNEHNLMHDFEDELVGYLNNSEICQALMDLELEEGAQNILANMLKCYKKLVDLGHVGGEEMMLLEAWSNDIKKLALLK